MIQMSALAALVLIVLPPSQAAEDAQPSRPVYVQAEPPEAEDGLPQSAEVVRVADWVAASGDNGSLPYAIIDKNAAALRDAMANYVGHARKVTGGRGRGKKGAAVGGPSAKEIRDWARSNGHSVPERGRIPADVREAFESAS